LKIYAKVAVDAGIASTTASASSLASQQHACRYAPQFSIHRGDQMVLPMRGSAPAGTK
jgi:hypothetical protein